MFMFLEPLAGWRHVKVTDRRTKQDFAVCMKELVEVHFPKAKTIRVVLDNPTLIRQPLSTRDICPRRLVSWSGNMNSIALPNTVVG